MVAEYPLLCIILLLSIVFLVAQPGPLKRWVAALDLPPPATSAATSTSSAIEDAYSTTAELKDDLRKAGMESCNLVVAIDHTQSNTFTGRRTFGGKNLHTISPEQKNLYEQAAAMVASTLR